MRFSGHAWKAKRNWNYAAVVDQCATFWVPECRVNNTPHCRRAVVESIIRKLAGSRLPETHHSCSNRRPRRCFKASESIHQANSPGYIRFLLDWCHCFRQNQSLTPILSYATTALGSPATPLRFDLSTARCIDTALLST